MTVGARAWSVRSSAFACVCVCVCVCVCAPSCVHCCVSIHACTSMCLCARACLRRFSRLRVEARPCARLPGGAARIGLRPGVPPPTLWRRPALLRVPAGRCIPTEAPLGGPALVQFQGVTPVLHAACRVHHQACAPLPLRIAAQRLSSGEPAPRMLSQSLPEMCSGLPQPKMLTVPAKGYHPTSHTCHPSRHARLTSCSPAAKGGQPPAATLVATGMEPPPLDLQTSAAPMQLHPTTSWHVHAQMTSAWGRPPGGGSSSSSSLAAHAEPRGEVRWRTCSSYSHNAAHVCTVSLNRPMTMWSHEHVVPQACGLTNMWPHNHVAPQACGLTNMRPHLPHTLVYEMLLLCAHNTPRGRA